MYTPVMSDISGPGCTLKIHEYGRGRVLQLYHHDRAQVPTLVSVREKVSWESTEGSVGNLNDNILN